MNLTQLRELRDHHISESLRFAAEAQRCKHAPQRHCRLMADKHAAWGAQLGDLVHAFDTLSTLTTKDPLIT